MSLLSSFLSSQLIPALEKAFIEHEPDMQEAFLSEVKALSDQVAIWVDSKIAAKSE